MIFNHHRFQIWNQNQHPFVHSMSDFGYANPNLPDVTNMQGALDYLVAVIYPNAKAAVATPGDLPLTGNTVGDYRVVNDDGDGRSAGYRWEQREGEAVASWHKIYDVDWSMNSILTAWQGQTLGLYVQKIGHDDADETGTPISGILAGQQIYGGKSANTNLTLSANSGDGAGPRTGFVQVTDPLRPTSNLNLSLGTATEKWSTVHTGEVKVGTMTITSGSITDPVAEEVYFGTTNIRTDGVINVGPITITDVSQILTSTGEIYFDTADLKTLGDIYADSLFLTSGLTLPSGSQIADFTFTNGNIACLSPNVDFNALNLETTGAIYASDLILMNNLTLYDNNIEIAGLNQNLNLFANGTGSIVLGSKLSTGSQITVNSAPVVISGAGARLEAGGLQIQGVVLSSIATNTNIVLQPNGFGIVGISSDVYSNSDNAKDLGHSGGRWRSVFIGTSLRDGTNTFTMSDLMKLKDANFRDSGRTQPAQTGDALFWDGSRWLASAPDTEIAHGSLNGLATGDAGHTQFALLAGRAGGQSLIGGTASGESLDLDSTAHATKGFIQAKSDFRPFTDASYSGVWSGTDLGGLTKRWKDVHLAGEIKGARIENVDTLPAPSSQKIGRLYYLTTDQNIYVDIGTTVKQVGGSRVYYDTSWNGVETTKDVTVSGVDARFAIWDLKDNTNDFEKMYVSIKATSATNVRITVGSPLPAGTYRLVGV